MSSSRLESGRKKLAFDWRLPFGGFRGASGNLRFDLKLSHKGIILVSVPLFFELLFLGVLAILLHQAEVDAARAEHSASVVRHVDRIVDLLWSTGFALTGLAISGGQEFAGNYHEIVTEIPAQFKMLDELVQDEPARRAELDHAANVANTLLDMLEEYRKSIVREGRISAIVRAKEMAPQLKSMADEMKSSLKEFESRDMQTEKVTKERERKSKQMVKGFIVVGVFFNIFLAFTVAIYFSRSFASRLANITENTRRLVRGEQLAPAIPGSDEIAHLDRIFRDMAEALAEAARKERAVIENAVDVICSIDAEGKFAAVSPASLKLWGYKPEELIGRAYTELVFSEDLEHTVAAFQSIMQAQTSLPVENRTMRKDGSIVSVLWSAFWSESERSMFCVAHDITERKQAEDAVRASEARVRQIIDSMPVGLAVIDQRGLIEAVNPAMELMFGYSATELIGGHLMTLFSNPSEQSAETFLADVFEKSLGRVAEREAVKSNGELFPTELSLKRITNREGERLLVNILDLSERKEVERLKREFVSTVSHELRTPLTAVRGSLTLMTAGAVGELNDQMRRVVTIAERNTIRLIGLINDLLDLDKLEVGQLIMNFDDVPLSSVIERSVESVRAFGDQIGVSIEADSTETVVYADGDRLVQVIVNLLSNAIKFSNKGSTVYIRVEQEPGWVRVSVVDKGRGIPEKYRELIFQRFQQVEVSDSKKRGGTGLGLAICKAIIEQHKGTIGVESEEGEGSTFWFRVPEADNSKEQRA
jgi:PAS domain S-box-containing protein